MTDEVDEAPGDDGSVSTPHPPHKPPGIGTRERLKDARRDFQAKKMLLSPSRRGGLGCAMAGVHAATFTGAIIALAAPCTAGISLGVMGAIAGIAIGAILGIPLIVVVSNAAKTAALEGATATVEQPRLPQSGGGGTETSVAVGPASREDSP